MVLFFLEKIKQFKLPFFKIVADVVVDTMNKYSVPINSKNNLFSLRLFTLHEL